MTNLKELKEKFDQMIIKNLHFLALPILRAFAKPDLHHSTNPTPRQFTRILEKNNAHPVETIQADEHTIFRIIE